MAGPQATLLSPPPAATVGAKRRLTIPWGDAFVLDHTAEGSSRRLVVLAEPVLSGPAGWHATSALVVALEERVMALDGAISADALEEAVSGAFLAITPHDPPPAAIAAGVIEGRTLTTIVTGAARIDLVRSDIAQPCRSGVAAGGGDWDLTRRVIEPGDRIRLASSHAGERPAAPSSAFARAIGGTGTIVELPIMGEPTVRAEASPEVPLPLPAAPPPHLKPEPTGRSRAQVPLQPVIPPRRHHRTGLLALTMALAILVGSVALIGWRSEPARADISVETLAQVDTYLQQASLANDPATIEQNLAAAQQAVIDANRLGASADVVQAKQDAIVRARYELLGVQEVPALTRVGGLPIGIGPDSQLVTTAGQTFLVAVGGVYQVDAGAGTLVEILGNGDRVDGTYVGPLQAGMRDRDFLVVSDGVNLFTRLWDGRWEASALVGAEQVGYCATSLCGSWWGSLYVVDRSNGEVHRKEPASRTEPLRWSSPIGMPVVDVTIDGTIHLLGVDGTVTTLAGGDITRSDKVAGERGVRALAFDQGTSGLLYVAIWTESGGQIVRYDPDSGATSITRLPASVDDPVSTEAQAAFAHLTGFSVDEGTGVATWTADGGIWQAPLPTLG